MTFYEIDQAVVDLATDPETVHVSSPTRRPTVRTSSLPMGGWG